MNKSRDFDQLFKLVVIGDENVGKTSLLLRFADDSFEEHYVSTIGVDFRFRTVTVDNQMVKLQIWDTAGQGRFRTITSAYYRGANGVILVYDIINKQTFQHVQDWLDEVHKNVGESITKLVVGNKADLVEQRQVTEQEGQEYSRSVNALFIETSAKTAANVDKAFVLIAKTLLAKSSTSGNETKPNTLKTHDKDDDKEKQALCQCKGCQIL